MAGGEWFDGANFSNSSLWSNANSSDSNYSNHSDCAGSADYPHYPGTGEAAAGGGEASS
jgi:hypothetical protein